MVISEIGQKMLTMQDNLAKEYNYKPLPPETAFAAMYKYLKELPEIFKGKTTYTPTGAAVKGKKLSLYTHEGTLLANRYERIVIGHYGAFIEIADDDMNKLFLNVKKGQEYRINDPEFRDRIKYQWWTAADNSDCKLYYQQKGVAYADYKPGYWYISPYEVKEE